MRHFIQLAIVALLLCPISSIGQSFKIQKTGSSIIISGTSSLHDWDIEAEDYSGTIEFSDLAAGQISNLNMSVVSESLKSGKSGMDSNTYKALNTKKYKNVTFKFSKVNKLEKVDDSTFKLNVSGTLTIVGASKNVNFEMLLTKLPSGVNLTGSESIKMTDFGIDPPKALMGTIKTGDKVTIKFNTTFK
ncbi:YceI family protein [Mangrovimonas sp. ST2L15]|uniref:YceI family protein n=1 Tax=Mangrovimonas sp. ST2L15 TaxID=1645916 RepID=UPI0006B5EB29|nr:YceI family protein [Mangrovimonas sp. ST2L15]